LYKAGVASQSRYRRWSPAQPGHLSRRGVCGNQSERFRIVQISNWSTPTDLGIEDDIAVQLNLLLGLLLFGDIASDFRKAAQFSRLIEKRVRITFARKLEPSLRRRRPILPPGLFDRFL